MLALSTRTAARHSSLGIRSLSSKKHSLDDMIPMSIADRKMQQSVLEGSLENLAGSGKPLSNDPTKSQVHVKGLSQNMEARAEAEMRRAVHVGLLDKLAGAGQPIDEEHLALKAAGAGGGAQAAQTKIQQHVLKSKA